MDELVREVMYLGTNHPVDDHTTAVSQSTQTHLAIRCDQDVTRLHRPVNDVPLVEVVEAIEYLP